MIFDFLARTFLSRFTSHNVWSAARLQGEIVDEVQSAQMYPASSWRLFSGP
jgi:hypothetical protein